MATADDLLAAMDSYKPDPDWNWVKDEAGAGPWLYACCQGLVAMWSAGLTGPGIPPWVSPATIWPHSHLITPPFSSPLMAGPMLGLGYTGPGANTFFNGIASGVATALAAVTVSTAPDGLLPHEHVLTIPSGAVIKAAVVAQVPITSTYMDSMITAVTSGISDFLTSNGKTLLVGAAQTHVHLLIV